MSPFHRLAAGVAVLGIGLMACALPARLPAAPRREGPAPPRLPAKAPARRDALGDPLPPGALLRLGSVRFRPQGTVSAIAYSPPGGRLPPVLASAGDRGIQLWDPATGKERRQTLGPDRHVLTLAFSPDGKLLAGGGGDQVCLWDVATGKELRRLAKQQGAAEALAFAPNGDLLAVGDWAALRLWEVGSGKVRQTFPVKMGGINAVAFSPDGQTVAAGEDDRTARLWKASSGILLHSLFEHITPVEAVAFSTDGKFLVTGTLDQTLIWEAATGKKVAPLGGTDGGSSRAVFSPDGKLLAIAGYLDYHIHLWDWATRKEVWTSPRRLDQLRSLSFSPDGKTLASASGFAVIYLWDVATGQLKNPQPGHQERLTSVAYTPDGRTIATAGWDRTVRLWDARTGAEKLRIKPSRGEESPSPFKACLSQVAFSPNGRLVAAVQGGGVLVWEAQTGKEVYRFQAGSVAFSPDGRWLACGSRDTDPRHPDSGIIHLYDLATGKQVRKLHGHRTTIASLTFSPDGKTLFSRGQVLEGLSTGEPGESETRFVRTWDVATGKERGAVPGGPECTSLTLSPDGRTVARTAMSQQTITLWESLTGEQRGKLAKHTAMVLAVAFAPDSRTLASTGMDGTVRLWALPEGQEIGRLKGHRHLVLALAFSPDGRTLVSGSLDSTALVWDVSRFTRRHPLPVVLSATVFESCWGDLRGDAAVAWRAVNRLASSGEQAVPFLRQRLRPAAAVETQRLARFIADLDSQHFQERERATRELDELSDLPAPALRQALAGHPPPEMKRRLQGLLDRLDATPPPEMLRQLRALEVLEMVGTPGARQVLQGLAGGASEARLTREAQAALKRLKMP